MKYRKINALVNKSKFEAIFNRNISNCSTELEAGEVFGFMSENKFTLYEKTLPRSMKSFTDVCLKGEIDENGNVKYAYRKTTRAFILTILAPLFWFLGFLLVRIVANVSEAYLFFVPMIFLVSCNFFKPKEQQEKLMNKLMCLIEQTGDMGRFCVSEMNLS